MKRTLLILSMLAAPLLFAAGLHLNDISFAGIVSGAQGVAPGEGGCSSWLFYTNTISGSGSVSYGDNNWGATLFTNTSTRSICQADIVMGSPTSGRTMVAKIYNYAGGAPTTQIGGDSDSVDTGTVPGSPGTVTFTWSSNLPSLTSGTYHFVIARSGATIWDGSLDWSYANQYEPSLTYAMSVSSDGSSWVDAQGGASTYRHRLILYGQ